ncbi:uncharacterized protein LOC110451711 [Mizuhopecten yessoensis]|uniref:Swi5-dependent recombination DNA repair protein 1 homolog n=1 Tax=Mizuhopecten yessoensis TaxID=6573 RepID=A0A210QL88_MIZYE|nr:uncharacterized protein LOC110451711 [Mizuhopecten yessoensis]OWF49494.1 Swi5-dependent recombination DNA repair protein 1-like [Mizuhopecten yessoensis]
MSSCASSAQKKLSSSLKERLKRCGRYHSSPIGPPTKKRIYYPDSTLPQTPVSTETNAKGDNRQDNLLSPVRLAAGFTDEAMGTSYGPSSTPLRSEKLKIDSTTSAKSENISAFTSPSECSNMVNISKATYRKHALKTPTVDSSLSPETRDTTSNEISRTISIIASPIASDGINSYNKRQSQGVRQVELCSLTPDTTHLVQKNITKDVSGHKIISEQRYERTPIRSRNVSSCKPSRLHFSGMSDSSYIDNDTEGSSAACKPTEQVGFQITSAKETNSRAKSISTDDTEMLQEKYDRLKNTLTEKEEELRKLNMVKMYRTKNDLDSLGVLVSKWRMTSQQALIVLHNKLQDPKPSLTQLIDHLQIEHSLVHFNPEDETFLVES